MVKYIGHMIISPECHVLPLFCLKHDFKGCVKVWIFWRFIQSQREKQKARTNLEIAADFAQLCCQWGN